MSGLSEDFRWFMYGQNPVKFGPLSNLKTTCAKQINFSFTILNILKYTKYLFLLC